MASEVSICNLALSHVSAYRIQSLNEASKEARECKTLYEHIRDTVLRDFDWNFARKRLVLALLPDTYTGWEYAYTYPTDCLLARKILDDDGSMTGTSYDIDEDRYVQVGKVEYEIITNATLNGKIILTDKEDAELLYTAKVTDPNMFDTLFVESMALKLGSELAQPLRANAQLQTSLFNQYMLVLGRAKAANANEGEKAPDNVNTLLRSRL